MTEENIEKTLDRLEYGDLDLNFEIENALIMVGLTKNGKTTCGHFLTQETPLRGVEDKHRKKIFSIDGKGGNYANAKIGAIQDKSQTEMPNFFYPKSLSKQNVTLIDFPGYHDSSGCCKMISNCYFHYRTFSKVKNIKFLIVMAYQDFSNTAQRVTEAIESFLEGFQNFKEFQQDIFQATSFMITKVPKQRQFKVVQNKINITEPSGWSRKQNKRIYRDLKDHIIMNEKLYIFFEPTLGHPPPNSDMIVKIYSKGKSWKRTNEKNSIVMNGIKISAASMVEKGQNNDIFMEQWSGLIKILHKKLEWLKGEMKEFLSKFIEQTFRRNGMDAGDSCLKIINQTVQRQILPRETKRQQMQKAEKDIELEQFEKQCRQYQKYENKRNQVRKRLIKRKKIYQNSQSLSNTPLWLKRIKVAEIMEQISINLYKFPEPYDETFFNAMIEETNNFFCSFAQVYPTENAYKYVYYIYRILQTTKVLYQTLKTSQNAQIKRKESITSGLQYFIRLPMTFGVELKDLFQGAFQNPLIQEKIHFCKRFKIGEKQSIEELAKIIAFYKETIASVQKQISNELLSKEYEEEIIELNIKKYQILALMIEEELKEVNKLNPHEKSSQTRNILRKILGLRKQVEERVEENRKNIIMDKKNIALFLRLTNYMGECCTILSREDLAIQCYKSIGNAHKLMDYYKRQYEKKSQKHISNREKLKFIEDYMKIARKYEEYDLASRLAKQAYYLCQMLDDFDRMCECGEFIKKLSSRKNDEPDFFTELKGNFYFVPLPYNKKEEIQALIQSSSRKGE